MSAPDRLRKLRDLMDREGLAEHEPPYLRFDADFVILPNMVFSIEPGLYVPGVGGFRHSDTVIVTETGARIITSGPREVEELIFD